MTYVGDYVIKTELTLNATTASQRYLATSRGLDNFWAAVDEMRRERKGQGCATPNMEFDTERKFSNASHEPKVMEKSCDLYLFPVI